MTAILAVIPARLASTRLPRKPLHLIAGRPLIEWVWRRVEGAGVCDAVVIATDSEEVVEAARRFGAAVEMTSPSHLSGTDRVAEVARTPAYRHFPVIVNIQGDEPFVRPGDIRAAVERVSAGGWEVGTVGAPLASLDEWRDPAVVKVVLADDGGALTFSRAPLPHFRDGDPRPADLDPRFVLRHVGIYAYGAAALLRWVALPEGGLERAERLEQLRPLAAGIRIGVARVEPGESGVDTPADAERAEARLRTFAAATGATPVEPSPAARS